MNSQRSTAIAAGALFIIATVASLTGSSVTGPILHASDYLTGIAANGTPIMVGALLSFVAAAASSGIAIALYPVLRKYNEGLALGAVGFRLMEGVFYMVGAVCTLSLVPVSREFASAPSQGATYFETLSHLLLTVHDLAGFVFGVLAFGVGALMYYFVLYRTRLIPRWLSVWGLAAIVLLIAASLLTLFDGEPFAISGSLIVLALPIALQEMVMAVWLIAKGFNLADTTHHPGRENRFVEE